MLVISENKLNELRNHKVVVYSREPLAEGVECFTSNCDLQDSKYYVTNTNVYNVKHDNGRFFYTKEDLSAVSDYWPADMLPIVGAFVSSNKKKSGKKTRSGKLSNSFLVDASGLPAFQTCGSSLVANEDISIHNYKFYLTLFNNYSLKECMYDRVNLFDAKFNSSKYDLVQKMQNSDFLKSKDFKMINHKRETDESVIIGLIIKEPSPGEYTTEYGEVVIDMNNRISIRWK